MTIIAHAKAPAGARLDTADTLAIALPIEHPAWCSRDDCEMSTGEWFHTRSVLELDAMDGDLLDTPAAVDVDLESIDCPEDGRHIPAAVYVSTTPLGDSTRRTKLTPAQAVELGQALTDAGRMAGADAGPDASELQRQLDEARSSIASLERQMRATHPGSSPFGAWS